PVVIIGAGLSGLVAAYRLKKAGVAIKILEARDRAGGRINTVLGTDGVPLEMGATWFGNQHQNLIELLKELKLPDFKQAMAGSAIFEASPSSLSQRIELPPQDPSFRIVGGTSKLIQALSNFFTAEEISYNEQVEQIFIKDEQVYIKTNKQTLSAKKTICCIPPALLVNLVKFSPELPEPFFTEARNTHTWMQESIKAGVVYKEPFWKDHKVSIIVSNQGPVIEY
ncbi:FAD-dependent oxidoreductase, partial [Salegentibacter sp. JZCK2]|uniref:flavin monoamine oxidase family protein n=1 Tax=Salegentibacter tibetensis TaxID=2873600 RepID=UPI001CCA6288